MKHNYIKALTLSLVLVGLLLDGCRKEDVIEAELAAEAAAEAAEEAEEEEYDMSNYPDWTEETHGNDMAPNYSVVFTQTEVLRLDITISSTNWSAMESDLASLLGSTGTMPEPPSGGGDPGTGGPPPGGNPGGTPGGDVPAGTATSTDDPIWVPCTVKFNEKEWYEVGIRFKGNSSLQSTYQMGNNKFSFKLDFDEYEDDYPALKNQRFYGFKQLNLNNNYDDKSLMREKVGADLFRQFGLAAAQTAFCVLYIDHGSVPQYYGVYTLVEEVDDTVLESQYADASGNLYKPDGTAASFASGTYNEAEMVLKTNEDIADYSDVLALYNAINNTNRTSAPESWKNELEAVFNVDGFLKWLAVNTTIQNWDTYGIMTHNYYLYNNPDNGLLTWIPWDNNEAFQEGKQGGALSLSLSEAGNGWPLIRYIIDQSDYETSYQNYLEQFISTVFTPAYMELIYNNYYNMLREYANAEVSSYTFLNSSADFDSAVNELKNHVQVRNDAVMNYLD